MLTKTPNRDIARSDAGQKAATIVLKRCWPFAWGAAVGRKSARFFRPLYAFTMVELLVVITIIVILAAILFPAIQSMRTKGMRTKSEEILKKIDSAIRLYSNDMGHYPYVWGEWKDGDQANAWAIVENNSRFLLDALGTTDNTVRYIAKGDLAVTVSQTYYVDAWKKPVIYVYVYPQTAAAPNDYATKITNGDWVVNRDKLTSSNNYGRPYVDPIGTGADDAPKPNQGFLFEFELWSAGPDLRFKNLRSSGDDRDNVTVTPWK